MRIPERLRGYPRYIDTIHITLAPARLDHSLWCPTCGAGLHLADRDADQHPDELVCPSCHSCWALGRLDSDERTHPR